jgi:hypothetical protein
MPLIILLIAASFSARNAFSLSNSVAALWAGKVEVATAPDHRMIPAIKEMCRTGSSQLSYDPPPVNGGIPTSHGGGSRQLVQ